MVEPMFKAPTPPSMASETPPETETKTPIDSTEPVENQETTELSNIEKIKQSIEQYLWFVLGGCLVFGLLLGVMMAGGDTAPQGPQGLLGVVGNPDITAPVPRCGRTDDNTSSCILYIMNHERYDKTAEDFFDSVVTLTGRPRFGISIENPTYAKMKIPPGYFAEIKVPSLR